MASSPPILGEATKPMTDNTASLNREPLMARWCGEIDGIEMAALVRKLTP
jgi:hypothetical protein